MTCLDPPEVAVPPVHLLSIPLDQKWYNRNMEELKKRLLEEGKKQGLKEIRVIPAEPVPFFEEAMRRRTTGDPESLEAWRPRGLVPDPEAVLPGARSILAALYPYAPYPGAFPQGFGEYSAYYGTYPGGMEKMKGLAVILEDAGFRAAVNPPLPFKAIAHRAGHGLFGKNGLIHNREFGSWISIHVLVTDAVLPYHDIIMPHPQALSDCADCDLCAKACPAGAIGEYGTVYLLKCLRHYMLSGEIVPEGVREAMGTKILGCEVCQRCCPVNAGIAARQDVNPEELKIFNIRHILKDHKEGFKEITAKIRAQVGQNYARPQRVLSSAIIAAGNSGDPGFIPALQETLKHPSLPIRVHSAWALSKLRS